MSLEKDTTTPKEITHDWQLFPEKYLTDETLELLLKYAKELDRTSSIRVERMASPKVCTRDV